MRKPALALTLFLLVSFLSSAQETKPAPRTTYSPVPVNAAREPNPVKSTPESIAEGKKIYGYDCAQCHGDTGQSKTDVAKKLEIPDLTNPGNIQTALTQVLDALGSSRLAPRQAGLLLYGLQIASHNCERGPEIRAGAAAHIETPEVVP